VSRQPLDQYLRRGIIEQEHQDVGKAFVTIRDCAFSRYSGRIYNDLGEGGGEIDAATLYANTCRRLKKRQFELMKLICFPEQRPDGVHLSEMEYQHLYQLTPNI